MKCFYQDGLGREPILFKESELKVPGTFIILDNILLCMQNEREFTNLV